MKPYVRIGGALISGILIILGALLLQEQNETEANVASIVSVAPERSYIETLDSDGDGIKDWEEDLGVHVFEKITAPSSTSATNTAFVYTPPTTFTGKFAEAFFQDFMEGKIKQGDLQDKEALVENAIKAIESNTQSKTFFEADIVVVPDSKAAFRKYGNEIALIIQQSPKGNEHELLILDKAVKANDESLLGALLPIQKGYTDIVAQTLRVETPKSFVAQQLALLNAYEAIRTDVTAMGLVFKDPLYSFARVKRYDPDVKALYQALVGVDTITREKGIVYSKKESGFILHMLTSTP